LNDDDFQTFAVKSLYKWIYLVNIMQSHLNSLIPPCSHQSARLCRRSISLTMD